MKIEKLLMAVDSHTAGEPTRVVIGGIPVIKGNTMPEKKAYLEKEMDYIRQAIMLEPRGHGDMFGSIITQPTNNNADLGIIFMDSGGYLNMCGHGTIGATTIAIELGFVPITEPITEVVLEAPAGLVKAKAKVNDGCVKEVSFTNVPAFLFKEGVTIQMPDVGTIKLDIAFGGSFFGIVHAKELKTKVSKENILELISKGMKLKEQLNKEIRVEHPELKHINEIDLIEIYDEPSHPDANFKNAVIFGNNQIDRSPCGTGTCAKMATLFAKGKLKLNETFVYESILGTLFKGRLLGETKIGELNAVIPEITGSAYITGIQQFMIDQRDPFKYGFTLK